jgi:hypothetical protein
MEVLRKRLAVLVAAAVMVLSVLAAPAAFAQDEFPRQGSGATDPNPVKTEASGAPISTPPQNKPGSFQRDPIANEKNPDTSTGRGERIGE